MLAVWISTSQAAVVHQPSDCGQWGQFDTTANLQVSLPAANAPCAYASSQDQGPLYSNGTTWVSLLSSGIPIGNPTARALSTNTALKATTITKPAIITVNLSSTATLTLAGGATNTASIIIG